eukprot:TRINITY_DN76888_c0_g1_i1.p1 TRINITY_DN76888_c0_g1~~TRINITY_DN76888_c0_g1_i1.p1  ORF type:complete len:1029 (-),score=182.71 TRINITY_DN76888_c0_g1_i1:101-3187(-)
MALSGGTWQSALKYWAEKASCAEIDMVGDSEFSRVWTYSVIYGITLAAGITIPFRWCTIGKRSLVIPDDADPESPAAASSSRGFSHESSEPDFKAAELHLRRTSCTKDGRYYSPFFTPTSTLSEIGGTGTELYFRNLRNLGFIFAYMAAITGPITAFSTLGSFGPDTGQFLVKTTIGNLGSFVDASVIDPWKRIVNLGCQGILITDLTKIFGWLDFASIIIFLVYTVWFRFVQIPKSAAEDNLEQVTPADFSLVIHGLPYKIDNQVDYERLLKEHLLERMQEMRRRKKNHDYIAEPDVVEVTLVRDYGGRLHEIKSRAELLQNIDIAKKYGKDKQVAKLEKYLEKVDKRLGTRLDAEETLPVIRAYVILKEKLDVQNLVYDYRFASYTLFRCCQFSARRFEGHSISLEVGPQPTDILWENQDISRCSRILRKLVMYLLFLVILAISLALIYVLTITSASSSKSSLNYIGVPECDPVGDQLDLQQNEVYKCDVTVAANWTMENATSQGGDILSCWCSAQGYEKMVGEKDIFDACGPWFAQLGISLGITTATSVVVLLINVLLQIVLIAMAEFERPLSMTALNSSMMQKVFFAQTLNTGFVLFFVNVWGPQVLRDFALIIPGIGFLLFRGPFAEITRGWYATVGVTLLTNMLLNMVVPASVTIAKNIMNKVMRRCCSRGLKHQAEIIKLYTNPEFDIKKKYAQVLTTVFVTLTYSSGLPLLNLFAAVFFFGMYWADKFDLLWGSKRPPNYDTMMAKECAEFMLYAVPLHCVFAVLMYGQTCVFPSHPLGGDLGDLAGQGEGNSPDFVSSYFAQVSRESTWMLFLLFVLLLALWVLWLVLWILGGTFGTVWDCLVVTCCPSWKIRRASRQELEEALKEGKRRCNGQIIDVAATMAWDRAAEHIEKTFPPASYDLKRHPDCEALAHLLRAEASPSKNQSADASGARYMGEGDAPPLSEATCQAPVSEEIATRFLEALHSQYVLGTGEKVSQFFESEKSCEATLIPFEEKVKSASDKNAEIEALAAEWGLPFP